MSRFASTPARPLVRRVIGLLAVALGGVWLVATSAAPPSEPIARAAASSGAAPAPQVQVLAPPGPPGCGSTGTTLADGALPSGGASPWDDRIPGIANLDSELLAALREAAREALRYGLRLVVTSGWRSPEHQARLLCEAALEHGSLAEASRWVAPSETSLHVSGDAVDVGPAAAYEWLGAHGARFGLCRAYRNEPWHFELRPGAAAEGCPRPYPDPAHDLRLRR